VGSHPAWPRGCVCGFGVYILCGCRGLETRRYVDVAGSHTEYLSLRGCQRPVATTENCTDVRHPNSVLPPLHSHCFGSWVSRAGEGKLFRLAELDHTVK